MEEWDRYFRGLLGGVEWKTVWGIGRREGSDGEEELRKEEVIRAVKKMKDGKAIGGDGIAGEVWKYGGEEVIEGLWEVCRKV